MEFRLVHLSDMHFATNPNLLPSPLQEKKVVQAIQEAWARVNYGPSEDEFSTNGTHCATHASRAARHWARFARTTLVQVDPHAYVVSGDVSATGSFEDLADSREYLLGVPRSNWSSDLGKPLVGIQPEKLVVLPGNHDRYRGRFLRPGGKAFDREYAAHWKPSSACERVQSQVFSLGGESLIVASADFTLSRIRDGFPPKIGYIGTGRVYQETLDALIAQTEALKRDSNTSAVVWVVHYPPCFSGISRSLSLHDDHLLADAARSSGVGVILCGHTHEARRYKIGEVIVNCAGTAFETRVDEKWEFSVCRFEVNRGERGRIGFVDFQFNKNSQDFMEQSLVVFHPSKKGSE